MSNGSEAGLRPGSSTANRQLEVIDETMRWYPPVWLFGGFAEDALLYGSTARPHNDIDLMVWLDELPQLLVLAAELGFVDFHVRWEARPDWPLAVGSVVKEWTSSSA